MQINQLHIFSQHCSDVPFWQLVQSTIESGDALLFIGNAASLAVSCTLDPYLPEHVGKTRKVFAYIHDLPAEAGIHKAIVKVAMDEIVELTASARKIICW